LGELLVAVIGTPGDFWGGHQAGVLVVIKQSGAGSLRRKLDIRCK
jgi:hypothetical protein